MARQSCLATMNRDLKEKGLRLGSEEVLQLHAYEPRPEREGIKT